MQMKWVLSYLFSTNVLLVIICNNYLIENIFQRVVYFTALFTLLYEDGLLKWFQCGDWRGIRLPLSYPRPRQNPELKILRIRTYKMGENPK
jgi:hypothetical protein